mmetsp:Transcript_67410/g.188085  ORF Transcript_67410/g.188085 Transcript_67410/m.188085 type:complete len:239 (-) Transcript_67410:1011-1727(-)
MRLSFASGILDMASMDGVLKYSGRESLGMSASGAGAAPSRYSSSGDISGAWRTKFGLIGLTSRCGACVSGAPSAAVGASSKAVRVAEAPWGRRKGGKKSSPAPPASLAPLEDRSRPESTGAADGKLMLTRSKDAGVECESASTPCGVCGRLRGVAPAEPIAAEGGRLNEAALLGDRSVADPWDVDRESVPAIVARVVAADWGCDLHKYAEEARAGVRGRMRPRGLGGIVFAVTRLPRP